MNKPGRIPGALLVIAAIGMTILLAMWSAAGRNVRTDDPANAPKSPALPDMRIDLNTATAAELSLLPGLGPALAQRIVDYRERHGPFESIGSLDRVSGIGAAILDRIRPHAIVTTKQ